MQIERLSAFADNYIFLLVEESIGGDRPIVAVVDPGDPQPVLARIAALNADLVAIFNTHHHHDHVGGNRALLAQFPQAEVYGGQNDRGRIPGQTVELVDGDSVTFGDRRAEVWFIPGHTRGHIAYYFPPVQVSQSLAPGFDSAFDPGSDDRSGHLFCGDTLFVGGCGRLKDPENTPAQLAASLLRLRSLPADTWVWCAHEYTLGNLAFALTIDRDNPDLKAWYAQVQAMRDRGEPTVPTTIGREQATNPFLRFDRPELQAAVNSQDPIQTFSRLRGKKDLW